MHNIRNALILAAVTVLGTPDALAQVSQGILSFERIQQNDTSLAASYRHHGITCPSSLLCTVDGSVTLPKGGFLDSSSTIILNGFGLQSPADSTDRLDINLTKVKYSETSGTFSWTAEFEVGLPPRGHYDITYDFTILLSQGNKLKTKEFENQCEFSDTTFDCTNSTTVIDAVPTGTQFLGFALQGFSIKTLSDNAIELAQLRVDASQSSIPFMQPTNRRQTIGCDFFGLNSSQEFEPYYCSIRSVALAVDSSWYDLNYIAAQGNFAINSATTPVTVRKYEYIQDPAPILGYWAGLSSFSLGFDPQITRPVTNIVAGCFDPHFAYPNGAIDWTALFTAGYPDSWTADMKCTTGAMKAP